MKTDRCRIALPVSACSALIDASTDTFERMLTMQLALCPLQCMVEFDVLVNR